MKFTGWKNAGYILLCAAMLALSSCGSSNRTRMPEDTPEKPSDSAAEISSSSAAESVVEIISESADTAESESNETKEDENTDSKSETGQTKWKLTGIILSLKQAVSRGGIYVLYPENDNKCMSAASCLQFNGYAATKYDDDRLKIRSLYTSEPPVLGNEDELIFASKSDFNYAPTKIYSVYDQGYSLMWRGDTGNSSVKEAKLMVCYYDNSRNAVYVSYGTYNNENSKMLVAIDGQTPEEYFANRGEEIPTERLYGVEIETDDARQVTLTFMEGTEKVDYTTCSVPWYKYNGPTYYEDPDFDNGEETNSHLRLKEPDEYYTINLNPQGVGDGYVPYDLSTVKNPDGESVKLPAGRYVVNQKLEDGGFYLSVIDVE